MSICRSVVDNVFSKLIKSDAKNAVLIIPVSVATLNLILVVVIPATISIILQGNIDGAVFDRSTFAIFNPTMLPILNFLCLFEFSLKISFCRSIQSMP